jgi:hypothetical protein
MQMSPFQFASLAFSGIGALLKSSGQQEVARQTSAQNVYQAQVARNNQIVANQQAADALARGEIEAQNQKLASKQLQGRIRAGLAGGGVQVGQGSALKEVENAAALGQLDALTIASNAEREALGFKTRARNLSAQATLFDAAGQSALETGPLLAGATLLTGFASVADKWHGFRQKKEIG